MNPTQDQYRVIHLKDERGTGYTLPYRKYKQLYITINKKPIKFNALSVIPYNTMQNINCMCCS